MMFLILNDWPTGVARDRPIVLHLGCRAATHSANLDKDKDSLPRWNMWSFWWNRRDPKVISRDEYPLPSSAALPPTFWWQASLASQGTTRPSPPAQEPHPPPLPCSQFGNGGVLSIGLPTLVFQRFCFGFKISRTLKDPLLTFLLFSSVLWRVSLQNGHCHWFPPPWRATGGTIPRKTSTASASPLITCHTHTLLYHQQQSSVWDLWLRLPVSHLWLPGREGRPVWPSGYCHSSTLEHVHSHSTRSDQPASRQPPETGCPLPLMACKNLKAWAAQG